MSCSTFCAGNNESSLSKFEDHLDIQKWFQKQQKSSECRCLNWILHSVSWALFWSFLSPEPSRVRPLTFEQCCSTLVALQHWSIGLVFRCLDKEIGKGKDESFSRLETETRDSVSGGLLCSLLSLKPSWINPRSLKKSCSIHVALRSGVIGWSNDKSV
jgi:hypothetical protein